MICKYSTNLYILFTVPETLLYRIVQEHPANNRLATWNKQNLLRFSFLPLVIIRISHLILDDDMNFKTRYFS